MSTDLEKKYVTDKDVGFTASITSQVTEKTIQQFAEMSGDYNPIHMDDAFAKQTRFGQRIAHGMIVGALISRALNEKLGGGGVYLGQSLKFLKPVLINDSVTVTITIVALRKEKGIASVETIAKNQRDEVVCKGEAMIMMSSGL
ncbi:MAG: MaoC family dehydratase [Pseudobdellovibrionaceae bacterium]